MNVMNLNDIRLNSFNFFNELSGCRPAPFSMYAKKPGVKTTQADFQCVADTGACFIKRQTAAIEGMNFISVLSGGVTDGTGYSSRASVTDGIDLYKLFQFNYPFTFFSRPFY